MKVGFDRGAGECCHAFDGVHDRAVEAELVQQGWAQLADEGANLAQLATEQLAQKPQFVVCDAQVLVKHTLDVLDLEDRVRERLGRTVVDLLCQA